VSRPSITVRIDFAHSPFTAIASLTWTDISAYVWLENSPGWQPISITRGRQFELDKMQAGTLTLILDNRDRRFDPDNVASPYYPNIIPTRRINVRMTVGGTPYDLYTGYVESWTPLDPQSGAVGLSVVRLTAVDLLKALSYTTFTMTESGDNNPVNVIQDVQNASGWPAADRVIGVNSPTRIPAQVWPSQPALPAIQTIATADGGTFFIETDGRTAYHDRYWTARNATPQAVFGDQSLLPLGGTSGAIDAVVTTVPMQSIALYPTSGTVTIGSEWITYTGLNASPPQLTGCTRGAYGSTAAAHASLAPVSSAELPYQDVTFSFDDTRLVNHADVTRLGGAVQTADDTSSQATYGIRAQAVTGLLITTDAEALARAQYMTILYALPYLRAQSLILNGDLAAAVWTQIAARTFDDPIVVIRRPPGGGAAIAKQASVQAINLSIGANAFLCTWQLSPIGNNQFFILDSATNGVLDTNRLAY
jgi:hypothetical protein